MKIEVDENRDIVLKEVYSGIGLISSDKEFLNICMRDTGFEFNYMGTWYEAKNGVLKIMSQKNKTIDNECDNL